MPMKNKLESVETEAEELLFYSDKEKDEALGTIGHLRIDFGRSGEEFNCTWFDHANSQMNDSYFKSSFDMFIDDLRIGVLKSRAEMKKFCRGKDDCRNKHSYTEDCWGFRTLTSKYAYYIRCMPTPGDYECYVYCYEKAKLMAHLAGEKGMPTHCYMNHPETGDAVMLRYAEKGYYPFQMPEGCSVEELNKAIGVTYAQQQAMEAGSMFGWRVPGADPKIYQKEEHKGMKIAIYQVNLDRDNDGVAFEGLERMEMLQGTNKVCPEIYDKVYECEIDGNSLEDVYRFFNTERPDDYKGRSLSVSDIVEVKESDSIEPGCYYCDSIGFGKVDFDASRAEEIKEEKLTVLIIEPEKKPYVKEIDSGLKSLQSVVDGDIETFYPTEDDVVFIVNEEGKISGLPLNRGIRSDEGELVDIIAGTFMIAGLGEDNFASLSQDMIDKYSEKYKNPEMFLRINGELHVLPMTETKEQKNTDKGDR